MGKSFGIIRWADSTENQLTVFTSRHELYGQYEEWCEEHGLTYLALPAFHRECETMESDHPIEERVAKIYNSGVSGADLHRHSNRYFGRPLPCQDGQECPYMEKREFDPNEYDVLIGHYLQSYNQDYLEGRFVAFDEFPGDAFLFEPDHNVATRAITNYLSQEDDLPFDNWKQLTRNRFKPEYQEEVEQWKDDLGYYSNRDTRWASQKSPDYHAHAPLLTHAGLEFELLDNQWEYAELNGGRVAARSPEDEWTVVIPPILSPAESVVALDGTPTLSKWRIVLGGWIEHEPVLKSDDAKRRYLRDVLGLEIVQTDAGTKPYQSGKNINVKSDGALLEGICKLEGKTPAVITSKAALEQYSETGVDQFIEGEDYFGNLKGSNQFAQTRLGVIIGSPHPPEHEAVHRWAAFDGVDVTRKTDDDGNEKRGVDLDFTGHGNVLFRDVVEYEVLQAVMRFGRDQDANKKGATVYVHTARLPNWVTPDSRIEVKTWSNGMQEVVTAIRESEKWPDGEWKSNEIAERVSVSSRRVRDLMKELESEGYVDHRRGGRGNAYHWSNVRLDDFTTFGILG